MNEVVGIRINRAHHLALFHQGFPQESNLASSPYCSSFSAMAGEAVVALF